MNTDFARRQMVEQQVRTSDVDDMLVLATLASLSRDRFVPPMYADLAYADTEIPLPHGQRMLLPTLEGRILQALQIEPEESVLEIGTGTGYLTLCLARLAAHVCSIDIFEDFIDLAKKKLAKEEVENATVLHMDAFVELPEGQFDVILVSGSTPIAHEAFVEKIGPGGRLFCVVGESPVKTGQLISKTDDDGRVVEELFETDIPELLNVPQIPPFSF